LAGRIGPATGTLADKKDRPEGLSYCYHQMVRNDTARDDSVI